MSKWDQCKADAPVNGARDNTRVRWIPWKTPTPEPDRGYTICCRGQIRALWVRWFQVDVLV